MLAACTCTHIIWCSCKLTWKLFSFSTGNTAACDTTLGSQNSWHGQWIDQARQLRDGCQIRNVDKLLGSCLLCTSRCSSRTRRSGLNNVARDRCWTRRAWHVCTCMLCFLVWVFEAGVVCTNVIVHVCEYANIVCTCHCDTNTCLVNDVLHGSTHVHCRHGCWSGPCMLLDGVSW